MESKNISLVISFVLLSVVSITTVAQKYERSSYKGWSSIQLNNNLIKAHIIPEIGGRTIQFELGGHEFFWVNDSLVGKVSPKTGLGVNREWLNYGGEKIWPAPQGWSGKGDQWEGPPDPVLDGMPYRANLDSNRVQLISLGYNLWNIFMEKPGRLTIQMPSIHELSLVLLVLVN